MARRETGATMPRKMKVTANRRTCIHNLLSHVCQLYLHSVTEKIDPLQLASFLAQLGAMEKLKWFLSE